MSEKNYLDLLQQLSQQQTPRQDRTGTGTFSTFGQTMRFDLTEGKIPLLTSKHMYVNTIIHELLWFLSGETDIQYLAKHNIHIWDSWVDPTTARYNHEGKLIGGDIGKGAYGRQWRAWEVIRRVSKAEAQGAMSSPGIPGQCVDVQETHDHVYYTHQIDQIQEAITLLKTNPFSRRILVSAWNPGQLDLMMLPPCHTLFQFYVTPQEEGPHQLSCMLFCRSQDLPVGTPFNIAQYALMTHMIAHVVGMTPKELVWVGGDCHIYQDQIEGVSVQTENVEGVYVHLNPDRQGKVVLNPHIQTIDDFEFSDITIEGYVPGPKIHYPVAV